MSSSAPPPPVIITTEVPQDDATIANTDAHASEADTAPASPANSSPTSPRSHARNFSITSNHNRNASLGSAMLGSDAAHLMVPGGGADQVTSIPQAERPASPTSTHSHTSTNENPNRTTLALRDHDNTHARRPSGATTYTMSSIGQGAEATTSAAATSDTADTANAGSSQKATTSADKGGAAGTQTDSAAKPSRNPITRLKAAIAPYTRAGRLAEQAASRQAALEYSRTVDPTPFPMRPYELADLVDPKSVPMLRSMGGVQGLLAKVGTDGERGLDMEVVEGAGGDVEKGGKAPQNKSALSDDFVHADLHDRRRVYGTNSLPEKKSKSFILLMWLALQDKILILLCIAAVVSLALGLYTDFGAERERLPCTSNPLEGCLAQPIDWVEGVAILIAVAIVDLVGSLNDFQKEQQFKKLNAKKEERDVSAIRNGAPMRISVHDVLVGDVLQIEPGEIIPADGVFLRGHNVKCDESGATGESDMIRKVTYDECIEDEEKAKANGTKKPNRDCFLISGARVLEGVGEYVVISVGPNSFNGRLMLSLSGDAEATPLQTKLNNLAELIAKLGSTAGALLFLALMIRFFVQLRTMPGRTPDEKGQSFIQILIIAVTVIVVAVPEGLPLAVTLALAFATKRMAAQNLLVRMLGSCETMANASVVCTDKTGTLTQNEMSVVAGSVGAHLKFAYNLRENQSRVATSGEEGGEETKQRKEDGREDWTLDQHDLSTVIKGPLRKLFNDAIAVNSTAFEETRVKVDDIFGPKKGNPITRLIKSISGKARSRKDVPITDPDAIPEGATTITAFVGSKTETALLKLAKELGWEDYRTSRKGAEVVQMIPFSSERKAMGVVVRLPDGGYRVYLKGASEVLSKLCTQHVDVPREGSPEDAPVETREFTDATRDNIARTIIFYANQSLRTIAVCYRDLPSWPPADAGSYATGAGDADGDVPYEALAQGLTLLAITGIEDPLRPGVRDAVAACARAGVQVKMCTGDNVLTARSIATQCGIYSAGGVILEGPVFRKLSEKDRDDIVPRLQVLARSSPEDKKILVETLKRMGEVVGVTGDGTNDGPALKTANVGFSMGIAGTEVAKEASDIILMDDNFASIVSAIMWGRCVNDAVRKFLQFQLSVNIVAVLVTFITAVASTKEQSALTAVQLLWVNLLMDTLAALALATDPASPALLDRKPDRRSAPLISVDMWKQILGQAAFQLIAVLVLHFAGARIFNHIEPSIDPAVDLIGANLERARVAAQDLELSATVFNVFVWCQLFSQVNSRRLDRHLNIFEGIHRNIWFVSIMAIEVIMQVVIMFVGGAAFSVTRINGRDWAISIIVSFLSWPIGLLIRLVPTDPIERFLIRINAMPDPNALPSTSYEADEHKAANAGVDPKDWTQPALGQVAERLTAFSSIRGGRSRLVGFAFKSKASRMREADVHPQSLMALIPALIGASVGGAWKPTNPAPSHIGDPTAGDPTVSSVALYQGGAIQFHPDTQPDDDFLNRLKRDQKGRSGEEA